MTAQLTDFNLDTPAGKFFHYAGGLPKAAEYLDKDKSWLWRWIQPKDKHGLAGRIPQSQQKKILKLAELYNWPITAVDLIS